MLQPDKSKLKVVNSVEKDVTGLPDLKRKASLVLDQLSKETQDKKELVSTGNIVNPRSIYYKNGPKPKNSVVSQEKRTDDELKRVSKAVEASKTASTALKRPLIYLSDPTKAVGDVLEAVGGNDKLKFPTSAKEREELAYNTNNPYKSSSEKLKYSLSKGTEMVPAATINLALAGEGTGMSGALKTVNNVINPVAGIGKETLSKAKDKVIRGAKTMKNDLVENYQIYKDQIQRDINTGQYHPKNMYYKSQERLKGDSYEHALFNDDPRKALEETNVMMDRIPKGRRFNEKSMSSDSYPLVIAKANKNRKDIKIIDTKSYNRMNIAGKDYQQNMPLYRSDKLYREMVDQKTLNKINTRIVDLEKNTGQKINKAKIVNGFIHVPNIILEKKGATVLDNLRRNEKNILRTGGAATAGMLAYSGKRIYDNNRAYDSISKANEKMLEYYNSPEYKAIEKAEELEMIREDSIAAANSKQKKDSIIKKKK